MTENTNHTDDFHEPALRPEVLRPISSANKPFVLFAATMAITFFAACFDAVLWQMAVQRHNQQFQIERLEQEVQTMEWKLRAVRAQNIRSDIARVKSMKVACGESSSLPR